MLDHRIHLHEYIHIYNVFMNMDASIIFESGVYLLFDILLAEVAL